MQDKRSPYQAFFHSFHCHLLQCLTGSFGCWHQTGSSAMPPLWIRTKDLWFLGPTFVWHCPNLPIVHGWLAWTGYWLEISNSREGFYYSQDASSASPLARIPNTCSLNAHMQHMCGYVCFWNVVIRRRSKPNILAERTLLLPLEAGKNLCVFLLRKVSTCAVWYLWRERNCRIFDKKK